jgi:hypothetical protein
LWRPGAGKEELEPSMHAHRIAGLSGSPSDLGVVPPWSDRVRGLGVCDALQLRLELAQAPWLLEELEEQRIAHEQGLAEAAAAAAVAIDGESRERAADDEARHRSELALLAAIRDRMTRDPNGDGLMVHGPAPLVSALVRGATGSVTDALSALAEDRPAPQDPRGGARLLELAHVADAWVQTLVELARIEWYTFEPGYQTGQSVGM